MAAKGKGRNCVVQLGTGSNADPAAESDAASRSDWPEGKLSLEKTLITAVPIKIAIEKLRGFVADHQAKIKSIDGDRICLEFSRQAPVFARIADRSMTFAIDLTFEEERRRREEDAPGTAAGDAHQGSRLHSPA